MPLSREAIDALMVNELARIRAVWPGLPDRFDPDRVSPAELYALGLPRRPDPVLRPRLYRFWRDMLVPRPRLIEPALRFNAALLRSMRDETGGTGRDAAARSASRWGSSRNWCGAVVSARDGLLFDTVAASWVVPRAETPAEPAPPGGPPGKVWQMSAWVGLDGFRRASLSLPQAGTVSQINRAGVEEYRLWVQWWVRDKMFGEVPIGNFPIAAGDEIHALLDVQSAGDVHVLVQNRSRGVSTRIRWADGKYEGDVADKLRVVDADRLRQDAPVEGQHAVWCVERPAVMPDDPQAQDAWKKIQSFRMPRFGRVIFNEALAGLRDPRDPAAPAVECDLSGARLLRMVDAPGDDLPGRARLLATPQAPARGGSRLQVDQA